MIEVAPNLFVGSDDEHKAKLAEMEAQPWPTAVVIIHACKEPYHRKALGYGGRGAPKDHPEYLVAMRRCEMCLNLVDADDPAYIPQRLIDIAVSGIRDALDKGIKVLIHCNQGHSRAPVLAMMALADELFAVLPFEEAEIAFRMLYPPYDPKNGMRQFAINNWDRYQGKIAVEAAPAIG
jgi:hypothetical protein